MGFKIGVDLDGVSADFDRHWRNEYRVWFGVEIPVASEHWDSFLDDTHFESEDEFWAWVRSVPAFWERMPVIPGAFGSLYELLRAGNEITFITSRPEHARAGTESWLARHYPIGFPKPRVEFRLKHLKGGIPVQVYLDDNPEVVESLREKPCVLIFDQPWNRDVKPSKSVHRVRGWGEVKRFIDCLNSGDFFEPDEIDERVHEDPSVGGSTDPAPSSPEGKVVDLMGALEDSVARAKEARKAKEEQSDA